GVAAERSGRTWREWAFVLLDAFQPAAQGLGGLVGEARTDLPGERQRTRGIAHADEQGADPDPRAFRIGEAADDELLSLDTLDLHPGGSATGHVRQVPAFRDDALEPHAAGPGEDLGTVADELELVQPLVAVRRGAGQGRELRLEALGQRDGHRTRRQRSRVAACVAGDE